ncbi:flagellar biosynthetic protein FliR [Sandarakinorhabdus sp.]|uniref:flagellar biosynthetic protein FliR n=1 Tax=Sandarakinorhabdus sp. TaxID=1916663 RepID=UPI00286DDEDF|nr:flagellar biosynthetic protein FliR [Sandarakinorhabdus sp.]
MIIEVPAFDGMTLMARFALAGVRPLAMLAVLPSFAGAPLPWRARLAMAAALASFTAFGPRAVPLTPEMLPAEALAGLLAGLAVALAFAAALLAGETVAQMIGLGFASLGPAGGNVTALSGLFGALMWGAFLASGAHLELFGAVVAGGEVLPPGQLTLARVTAFGALMFASGLRLALPIVAVLLLGNALVAIASRSAPQLSAMAIGPAVLLLGFVWSLPMLFDGLWRGMIITLDAGLGLVA